MEQGVKGDIIFDMARDKVTIARLRSLEDEGALVINSAYGIDNCVPWLRFSLSVRYIHTVSLSDIEIIVILLL